jgi:hypothetical protein
VREATILEPPESVANSTVIAPEPSLAGLLFEKVDREPPDNGYQVPPGTLLEYVVLSSLVTVKRIQYPLPTPPSVGIVQLGGEDPVAVVVPSLTNVTVPDLIPGVPLIFSVKTAHAGLITSEDALRAGAIRLAGTVTLVPSQQK